MFDSAVHGLPVQEDKLEVQRDLSAIAVEGGKFGVDCGVMI